MGRKRVQASAPLSVEKRVALSSLAAHPRNYKVHPADQITHLRASLRQYGFFRRIVISSDDTILAGHGLAQAARDEGITEAPVVQYSFDSADPRALKLVALDNEIGNFAEVDDRMLTDLLQEISGMESDIDKEINGLMGTGFDESMLSALVFATRPPTEFGTKDAAAEWAGAGMPEYGEWDSPTRMIVCFRNKADRDALVAKLTEGMTPEQMKTTMLRKGANHAWTIWFPPKDKNEAIGVEYAEEDE